MFNLISPTDFMYYQNQIVKYHTANNQVPALDAYVRSLHGFSELDLRSQGAVNTKWCQ